MKQSGGDARAMGEGYKSLALGFKFAGGIVIYAGIGFLVDRKLGSLPFGVIAGAVLGSVLSFYSVYKTLTEAERRAKAAVAERRAAAPPPDAPQDGPQT